MKVIEPSELILNSDNSVYHLNLKPEDISENIILVGDPDRVPEVSKHFDKIELKKGKREFITHTGFVGKQRLTVISTGIGTDNIDIVLTELDALVNIDLENRCVNEKLKSLNFIRIGTSGSLQSDIDVDSMVANKMAVGLDNLLLYYNLEKTNVEFLTAFENHIGSEIAGIKPYLAFAGTELIDKFSGRFTIGITATCPGFYGPQGRVLRNTTKIQNLPELLTSFNFKEQRITNFEMETSGIYGLSNLMGHQAISLNAIVANRVKKEFSSNAHATIEKLIVQALEIISAQ